MTHLILLSGEAPDEIKTALSERFDVLCLPPDPALPAPVAAHPDMIALVLGDTVVMPEEYLGRYPEVAAKIKEATGIGPVGSRAARGPRYPDDIALNCAAAGGALFCLVSHTAPEIKEIARRRGLRLVNVRQGYAACSSLVADSAVVTADPSVADAVEAAGLDVLRISPGGILLPGYDSGFIGGASGVAGRDVFFFGDPATHPDGERIVRFLSERGFRSVPLRPGPLLDLGGFKHIKNASGN